MCALISDGLRYEENSCEQRGTDENFEWEGPKGPAGASMLMSSLVKNVVGSLDPTASSPARATRFNLLPSSSSSEKSGNDSSIFDGGAAAAAAANRSGSRLKVRRRSTTTRQYNGDNDDGDIEDDNDQDQDVDDCDIVVDDSSGKIMPDLSEQQPPTSRSASAASEKSDKSLVGGAVRVSSGLGRQGHKVSPGHRQGHKMAGAAKQRLGLEDENDNNKQVSEQIQYIVQR